MESVIIGNIGINDTQHHGAGHVQWTRAVVDSLGQYVRGSPEDDNNDDDDQNHGDDTDVCDAGLVSGLRAQARVVHL